MTTQTPQPCWTLLMTGKENGLVGKYGSTFPSSPEYYPRVNVISLETHDRCMRQLHKKINALRLELYSQKQKGK